MNKFSWKKFKNGEIVVNCRTEEIAKEFVEECYKRDIKWGFDLGKNITCYEFKEEDTSYLCKSYCTHYTLMYASASVCRKAGYEVVEYIPEEDSVE